MARMVRWLALVTVCLVCAFPLMAATELEKTKGDYSILCLGDSKAIVKEKIQSLKDKKEIQLVSPTSFKSRFLEKDVECKLFFYQNKLYQIWLGFPKLPLSEYNGKLKKMVEKELIPSLSKIYGSVSEEYGYPASIDSNGSMLLVAEWIKDTKGVLIGLTRITSGYVAYVEIYDTKLLAAAEEAAWEAKAEKLQ